MSLSDKIDETFAKLLENIITKASFTETDLHNMILKTKEEVLTILAVDNITKVSDAFQCVTSTLQFTENMCIMPDKKIRANL